MSDETSATSHLADDVITVTPDDVTKTTGESVTSPWSWEGAEFYFQYAVILIVIGIVGTAANDLIVYALVASKQHKKHLLIVNQNVLDLASCIFLVIIFALKISNLRLTGLLGYWLCVLIFSEAPLWVVFDGSQINLVIISIERYLKVVHPVWSKNKLRNWMIYSSMSLCWLFPFVYNMYIVFTTSIVVDGVCHAYFILEDQVGNVVYSAFYILWYHVLVILISAMCYWRILVAIRRQSRVMTGHNTGGMAQSSAAQAHAHHIQSNVIKTMILVCLFYAVSRLPSSIYYPLYLDASLALPDSSFYAVTFVSFLYVCMNPFIYATKFKPVMRYLKRLFLCQKDDQPSQTLQTTAFHTARKHNFQEHQL